MSIGYWWHVFRRLSNDIPFHHRVHPLWEQVAVAGRGGLLLAIPGYDFSVRMEGYEPVEGQRELDINGRRKKQRSCAECR